MTLSSLTLMPFAVIQRGRNAELGWKNFQTAPKKICGNRIEKKWYQKMLNKILLWILASEIEIRMTFFCYWTGRVRPSGFHFVK